MESRKKLYIISAASMPIILFLFGFLIYWVLGDIKNGSREILSNKERAIFIDMEAKGLDNFRENYKNYEPNLKKINQLFIDTQNPVDFIKFLEKIAFDSNVKINISLVSSGKSETNIFQIYIQGSFMDVLRFSENLETSPYLIRVNNLTMKKLIKNKAEDLPNQVGADISLEVIAR